MYMFLWNSMSSYVMSYSKIASFRYSTNNCFGIGFPFIYLFVTIAKIKWFVIWYYNGFQSYFMADQVSKVLSNRHLCETLNSSIRSISSTLKWNSIWGQAMAEFQPELNSIQSKWLPSEYLFSVCLKSLVPTEGITDFQWTPFWLDFTNFAIQWLLIVFYKDCFSNSVTNFSKYITNQIRNVQEVRLKTPYGHDQVPPPTDTRSAREILGHIFRVFRGNSISTLEIDIVWSEQGYFEYDVDNEQWQFRQKLFRN